MKLIARWAALVMLVIFAALVVGSCINSLFH